MMAKEAVNINESLEEYSEEVKTDIINRVKIDLSGALTLVQKQNFFKLIDLAVEFKQIPDQKLSKTLSELPKEKQIIELMKKWLKKHVKSINTPPSKTVAKSSSKKDTVEDPALEHILYTYYQKVAANTVSRDDIAKQIYSHNLLMSIENIQGHLLEEYIASVICQPPYNFIWCNGETIKAADFCKRLICDGQPILYLLQIKNKYNTENSSSNKIRVDTPIKPWYRLGKEKGSNGKNIPVYKWNDLNGIIEDITNHEVNLNEADYRKFLTDAINQNSKILSVK